MLGKLLSNIGTGNSETGEKIITECRGNESQNHSSEKLFKSLLEALQNDNSSDKVKKKLMSLSAKSGNKDSKAVPTNKRILGGLLSTADTRGELGISKPDGQHIMKELQKEVQNIKKRLVEGETSLPEEQTEGKIKGTTKNKSMHKTEPKSNNTNESKVTENSEEALPGEGAGMNLAKDTDKQDEVSRESKADVDTESRITGTGNVSESQNKRTKTTETKPLADETLTVQADAGGKGIDINGNVKEEVKEKTDSGSEVSSEDGEKNKPTNGSGSKGTLSRTANIRTDAGNKENEKGGNVKKGGASTIQDDSVTTSDDVAESELKLKNQAATNGIGNAGAHPGNNPKELQNKEGAGTSDRFPQNVSNGLTKLTLNYGRNSTERKEQLKDRPMSSDIDRQEQGTQLLKNRNKQSGNGPMGRQAVKSELAEKQKIMGSLLRKSSSTNISAKGLEMKGAQIDKAKKSAKGKRESGSSQHGFGDQSSKERNKLLSRLGISNVQAQKQAKPLASLDFAGISANDSSMSLQEQKVNWEEQVSQTVKSTNEKESKTGTSFGSVRLGQIPIANISLRKKVLPGLTKGIKKLASSAKENAGQWQKHNFVMDDGKNIQLSVRESKGVLQVKMGSMNLDLSKLLQQNLQQIREHLRHEFGSEIALQFENQQQGAGSQLPEDTGSSDHKREYRRSFTNDRTVTETVEELSSKTVRDFGYNQMEWTA